MRQLPFDGPDADWLTHKDVLAALDVGARKLARLIAEGRFPAGVRVSGNGRHRWPARDVAAFLYLVGRGAGPADNGDDDEE